MTKKVLFIGGPIDGKTQILPDGLNEVPSPTGQQDEKGEEIMYEYQIADYRNNTLLEELKMNDFNWAFGFHKSLDVMVALDHLINTYIENKKVGDVTGPDPDVRAVGVIEEPGKMTIVTEKSDNIIIGDAICNVEETVNVGVGGEIPKFEYDEKFDDVKVVNHLTRMDTLTKHDKVIAGLEYEADGEGGFYVKITIEGKEKFFHHTKESALIFLKDLIGLVQA